MVGNDLAVDIQGAKGVGMHTVFFSVSQSDWTALSTSAIQPEAVVRHLRFLPQTVACILDKEDT